MSQVLEYSPIDPRDPKGRAHRPLVELLLLSVPTIAQMASYTLMQFADRFMLAYVGDLEAATAGTAGMAFWCVLGFGMGILFLVNTLVAQAYGRGDHQATGRFLWQGIWIALGFGVLTAGSYPFADDLFTAMGHEPKVVALESQYFRVVSLYGCVKLAAMAGAQFLLAVHRPNVVFVAAFGGAMSNILFNWLLIYGNWGFPKMGVAGAAWGTNAAVTTELLVLMAYILRPSMVRMFNTFDFAPRLGMLKTTLRFGIPSGFQFICDITAWTVFMNVIVAKFSTPALAATSFVFAYMHICFMPALGVGSAVTALVGKYIGMKRPDLAERRAHLGFAVCSIYMVAAGLVLFAYRRELIALFTQDAETLRIGMTLMLFLAIYQIFDAMFVVYSSALRGAGDTLVPAAVQGVLVWSIVVGGGYLMAEYRREWGVVGPWLAATVFGGILGLFLLARFVRGRWKSIQIHSAEGSNVPAASATVPA
jgi:MATE family multidrug resistance protein